MKLLKCPVCHREVAQGFARQDLAAAAEARNRFVQHAGRQHGVGELDALLYFAEALRRHALAA